LKTLKVYCGDSYFIYHDLYSLHLFEIGEALQVFKIDKVTGQEHLTACFKNWDYLLIEE